MQFLRHFDNVKIAHLIVAGVPFYKQQNCIFDAYESIATVGESRVWWRADFQSGSRVLKEVF